jgi:hypothetical protein
MVAFMFWNVARKPVQDVVAIACCIHRVDVLLLAECNLATGAVIAALNEEQAGPSFSEIVPAQTRVRLFSRLPRSCVHPLFSGLRFSIYRIAPPLGLELLLVAAHLPSKLHGTDGDQYYVARDMRSRIAVYERHVGHQNTLIVGDLNMNPFDIGMTAADGLHGVMDKRIVARGSRQMRGKIWDFFYNPMWSRLGDESDGPTGTYRYTSSGLDNLYWHTFDQVLIRPDPLPYYDRHKLLVLSQVGPYALETASGIDESFSDHLPVVIELNTERSR